LIVHLSNVVAAFSISINGRVDARDYQKGNNHSRKGMPLIRNGHVNDVVGLQLGEKNHEQNIGDAIRENLKRKDLVRKTDVSLTADL